MKRRWLLINGQWSVVPSEVLTARGQYSRQIANELLATLSRKSFYFGQLSQILEIIINS